MTPPQSNRGVRRLICHKKVRKHGYKGWRNLGSLTLYSHLSNVEDFTCSFYVFILSYYSILQLFQSVLCQKPLVVNTLTVVAKKGFSSNQDKLPRVQEL